MAAIKVVSTSTAIAAAVGVVDEPGAPVVAGVPLFEPPPVTTVTLVAVDPPAVHVLLMTVGLCVVVNPPGPEGGLVVFVDGTGTGGGATVLLLGGTTAGVYETTGGSLGVTAGGVFG